MSRIGPKDTKPELILRRALHQEGFRYRVNPKDIQGKPDICWKGKQIAVFVHGCFWHGCPEHFQAPKTNALFWAHKISNNMNRDERIRKSLEDSGWVVIELWEHEIESDLDSCIDKIHGVVMNNG